MDINDRVSKLERQNRWLRGGVVACVAVACIAMVMAIATRGSSSTPSGTPTVLRAQKFVLETDEGKRVGTMACEPNGSPYLMLASPGEKYYTHLSANPKRASVVVSKSPTDMSDGPRTVLDTSDRPISYTEGNGQSCFSVIRYQGKTHLMNVDTIDSMDICDITLINSGASK